VVLTTVSYIALPHAHAHGQLPYRDHSLVTNVVDEGRPLVQELGGVTASGSGLWYRNDTLFSAQFSGAGRFVAFKILGQTQWRSYSIERVTTNITSQAVSKDGRYIVLGYEGGAIELSDDGGKTFRAVTSPTQHNVINIAISSDGTIVIGRVPEGHLFTSSDRGQSWVAESFPELVPGSAYGSIGDLKFSSNDALSFTTAEITQSGDISHMVLVRWPQSEWQVFRVGYAWRVFMKTPGTLLVSTARPIPGRVDQTSITELMKIDVPSGRIDTAFSFVKDTGGKVGIGYAWASEHEQVTLAFSRSDVYSMIDTSWFLEPYELPVLAEGPRSIVRMSARELYAVSGNGTVIRIQLSPTTSIPRFLDSRGNVAIDMTYDRLPPRCVVYDMLGRVVHSNHTDEEQSWAPQFAGTYFLYDTKAAKLTALQY
jgi:hypothetical protein